MRCPALTELPAPEPGLTGWPWTEETPRLGVTMPDGRPWPRVSVVTPSLNQVRFLEETIRSVLLQGYPDIEYVVVDGGSDDGSAETIEKYEPWLTWRVSEPDGGQVEAIAKGLARTTGEIFNWINSDDLLQPAALAAVALAMGGGADIFAGSGLIFGEGREVVPRPNRNMTARKIIRGDLDVELLQPAIWFRRSLIDRCAGLDPAFHYYFDVEMLLRYLALSPRVRYGNEAMAAFRMHSASKTVAQAQRFFAEYRRALEKLAQMPGFEMLWTPCRRRLEELDRHRAVARVLGRSKDSRWRRLMEIVALAPHHPRPRMLRIAAAAVCRLIRNQPWITLSRG